ncbi:MAG: hypothetical protein OCD76_04930 [Reichenbachiella sp.]
MSKVFSETIKVVVFLAFFVVLSFQSQGQGVSMSVLIPKNGYISTPVSPFSIRGLGYNIGVVGFSTGASLYSMPGLPLEGLPFESDKPMTGPHWSILVPLQLTLEMNTRSVSTRLLAGGFGIWHIDPKLNYGNVDRAIAEYEDWQVANADLNMKTQLGYGWMAGIEFAFHVNKKYSLTMEVQYLSGGAKVSLDGSYAGGTTDIVEKKGNYPDASMMLEGLEISLGVTFN